METITLKVRTKKQAELLLAKIKELENENFMITTKYKPIKEKATKKAKVAPAKQVVRYKKKPVEQGSTKGLKELKLALAGKGQLRDAREVIEGIKNGK